MYAERHRDKDGVNRFDDYVFDEEYMTLFERLFLTCRAEADRICAAYLMERNEPPGRDYVLQLCMPPHWMRNMAPSLENKLGYFKPTTSCGFGCATRRRMPPSSCNRPKANGKA